MSKTVYFKQIEYHQVHLHRSMAIEQDQIIGHGLSAQRYVKESVDRFSAGAQTPTMLGDAGRWVLR